MFRNLVRWILEYFFPWSKTIGILYVDNYSMNSVIPEIISKMRKWSYSKTIILGIEEANEMISDHAEKSKGYADILQQVLDSGAKIMLMVNTEENFDIYQLVARTSSDKNSVQDDFKYGGGIYPSGECFVFDEHGNKQRNLMRR